MPILIQEFGFSDLPMSAFLEVRNLSVGFPTEDGFVQATNDVSFSVELGQTLAIVGESGSGKSVSNLAIMGLHNPKSTNISGQAIFNLETGPIDVLAAPEEIVRKMRGKTMSMIFQDPMSSLHPFYSIGNQISEAWLLHNDGGKKEAKARAVEMLDLVGIPGASRRVEDFPHQFSGGMRQRAMIAMALINNPKLLIADEPTTALDVTIQAQIMELIKNMQKEFNMAVILITHDLGIVAEVANDINVMYAGRLVETGEVDDVFYNSDHPYTRGLLASIPRVDGFHSGRLSTIPGQPPSLIHLPSGCSFSPRCAFANQVAGNKCLTEMPMLLSKAPNHFARCHLSETEISTAVKKGVGA
jgi:peptide/nickel transport system ATP-binding protein